jgi:hypothetical protein
MSAHKPLTSEVHPQDNVNKLSCQLINFLTSRIVARPGPLLARRRMPPCSPLAFRAFEAQGAIERNGPYL